MRQIDILKKVQEKFLNEVKQDIYPKTSKEKTDATSTVRGGLKGERGNFNIRVDTIGKANTKAPVAETSIEEFQKLTSHISGLASFGRNIDNPSTVGGNEINEFVRSELAKLLVTAQMNHPDRKMGVIIKALKLRRPEALKMAMVKIEQLLNDCLAFVVDNMKTKNKIVQVADMKSIISDFSKVKNNIDRMETFFSALRLNKRFKETLAVMANDERYSKWF